MSTIPLKDGLCQSSGLAFPLYQQLAEAREVDLRLFQDL